MRHWLVLVVILLTLPALVWGDSLILNDGTVLEGTIIRKSGGYWVKTPDGRTRTIPDSDVKSYKKSAAPAGPSHSSATRSSAEPESSDFAALRRRAERVETPLAALALWQDFIDKNPDSPDLEAARGELARWQQMVDGKAERINGKWVWGEDREKILKKAEGLVNDYVRAMDNNQTLESIKKLEEALKIYPNHFQANFEMGFFHLVKGNNQTYDKAIKCLEMAVKLRPDSAAAMSNLAIAYNFRDRYEDSVLMAFKAAQIEDTPDTVQNLVNALMNAPPGMRRSNTKVLQIKEETRLLASKHGIGNTRSPWKYIRPGKEEIKRGLDENADLPGLQGSGTGLVVSADGYILTNRHVAEVGDLLMVRFSDGAQKKAEIVVMDDEQDIAVLKVKSDKPLAFVQIAPYDAPTVGSDVTVLGFPLGSLLGSSVKLTRGIVTAFEKDHDKCDVIVDAQVNPGNSGGPMVDKYGHLMALTSMKSFSSDAMHVSSYGMGISAGRVRDFVKKHQSKLPFAMTTAEVSEGAPPLSTEEIARTLSPATVCVLMIREESESDKKKSGKPGKE